MGQYQSQFTFFILAETDIQNILEFSCLYYYPHDPLLAKNKTTVDSFKKIYKPLLLEGCRSGFSVGVSKQKQLVGFATSICYQKFIKMLPKWNQNEYLALYLELQNLYKPKNPKRAVQNCIGATKSQYQKKGLSWMIGFHIQKYALKLGYTEFIVDLNHPTLLNKIINKLGYKIVAQIYYKDFCYKGCYPFIQGVKSSDVYYLVSKIYETQANQVNNKDNHEKSLKASHCIKTSL